jgi:Zn-dependent peptidase ImmA (M78 family)
MPTRSRTWNEPLVAKLIARHSGHSPEEIIERHAEQLRRSAEQEALPVDVDLVASVHGVKRRRREWNFAGRIYADEDGQLVMDLNGTDREERQRFTCAHELMHLAFPGFKKETRYRLDTKSPGQNAPNAEEEYLCDLGAAALLMPRRLVADRYAVEDGLACVEQLANDANVSLQAAGNRIISLTDQRSAFLVFDWSHKPADRPRLRRGEEVARQLRLRYAIAAHLDAYLPRFKSAPSKSVFCRAWNSHSLEHGRELLPGADNAGAFDVEAKAYGSRERRVVLAVARRVD